MHGTMVSCTWPQERAALVKGMPKTKHITAKKVTLTNIELAMTDMEILEDEYIALQMCEL